MTKLRINSIVARSHVDGPGDRTVVFLQGCTLACPGCQNRHLWPANGGHEEYPSQLATTLSLLASRTGNVTISGGEPFQQPAGLSELVDWLHFFGFSSIIVYTGYTWEQLHDPSHPAAPWLSDILSNINILVDGPFVKAQDDDYVCYRGSSNQRPIDVQESLDSSGQVVTINWDNVVSLAADGSLILPLGLAAEFSCLGDTQNSPMCGQTRRQ